ERGGACRIELLLLSTRLVVGVRPTDIATGVLVCALRGPGELLLPFAEILHHCYPLISISRAAVEGLIKFVDLCVHLGRHAIAFWGCNPFTLRQLLLSDLLLFVEKRL